MPTLLEAANEALLMVGEREVSSLTSSVGRKARLAIRSAQQFVGILHQWRHLRVSLTTTPAAFIADTATLAPFSRVFRAYVGTLDMSDINSGTMSYKANTTPLTGSPVYYAIKSESKVQFYPSPLVADQSRILLDVLLKPTIATNATDTLEGPDEYVGLVVLYAQVILHRTHTTDLNASESTAREFETRVHMYRTLNVLQPVSFIG